MFQLQHELLLGHIENMAMIRLGGSCCYIMIIKVTQIYCIFDLGAQFEIILVVSHVHGLELEFTAIIEIRQDVIVLNSDDFMALFIITRSQQFK